MEALQLDHVSKTFIGGREYAALRDDLVRLASFARARRRTRNLVHALDDVSLSVREGESVGLLGENGAGKTTALKIASRITYPTTGTLRVRGRVGALIEVGTGMHPELTGRENIHLYGRILGLSKGDIRRRLDSIVDFADIGPALEQPVKQFSTGMQLRLGFSLASHLEPDVLLVDEAIAVGDAGFQYRCVERMRDLVREGRSLVLVSHDMGAIEALCERAVLLSGGQVAAEGPARDVILDYLKRVDARRLEAEQVSSAAPRQRLEIYKTALHDLDGRDIDVARSDEPFVARLHYRTTDPVAEPLFDVGIVAGRAGCIALASMLIDGNAPPLLDGEGSIDCVFENLPFHPGVYELWGSVHGSAGYGDLFDWQRLRVLRIAGDAAGPGKAAVTESRAAPVKLPYHWRFNPGSDRP